MFRCESLILNAATVRELFLLFFILLINKTTPGLGEQYVLDVKRNKNQLVGVKFDHQVANYEMTSVSERNAMRFI